MIRTILTIVTIVLLFFIARKLQNSNEQKFDVVDTNTYFDMGTGIYNEPFVGILSSRPSILVRSLNIAPYKYFASDTLRFKRTFNIEFNEESVRYYEQKRDTSKVVFKPQHGVTYTPSSVNVAAMSGKMHFYTTCVIKPELGNTVTMTKMELNQAAVDEVNSQKVTSTGYAYVADCRAEQRIGKPWVLWYLWLLTALLPFLIVYCCMGNKKDDTKAKTKKDDKNNKTTTTK